VFWDEEIASWAGAPVDRVRVVYEVWGRRPVGGPLGKPLGEGAEVKLLIIGLLSVSVLVVTWRILSDDPTQGAETGTPRQPALVAVDSSGHDNDGVNQGSPAVGLPGRKNTAYSFDREGSWVQVASKPSLNPGPHDFLFSAWVNLAATPALGETYDVIRKGLTGTPGGEFKLEVVPEGRLKCSAKAARGRSASILGPATDVTDGKWHRIGCARTGSSWSAILDGEIVSKTVDLGSISNALPLSIGSKYGRDDVPRGRVDEVMLFIAHRRPAADSLTLFLPRDRVEQLRQLTPVGLWHLDEKASRHPRR